jgi:vacuolar-type H+-ATPase subunit H
VFREGVFVVVFAHSGRWRNGITRSEHEHRGGESILSALQEVLAVLLGAESEANHLIEEGRDEADRISKSVREKFAQEREHRLRAAREQAKAIVESARSSADVESAQILSMAQQEAAALTRRFEENGRGVVKTLVAEIASQYLAKGGRPVDGFSFPGRADCRRS